MCNKIKTHKTYLHHFRWLILYVNYWAISEIWRTQKRLSLILSWKWWNLKILKRYPFITVNKLDVTIFCNKNKQKKTKQNKTKNKQRETKKKTTNKRKFFFGGGGGDNSQRLEKAQLVNVMFLGSPCLLRVRTVAKRHMRSSMFTASFILVSCVKLP